MKTEQLINKVSIVYAPHRKFAQESLSINLKDVSYSSIQMLCCDIEDTIKKHELSKPEHPTHLIYIDLLKELKIKMDKEILESDRNERFNELHTGKPSIEFDVWLIENDHLFEEYGVQGMKLYRVLMSSTEKLPRTLQKITKYHIRSLRSLGGRAATIFETIKEDYLKN